MNDSLGKPGCWQTERKSRLSSLALLKGSACGVSSSSHLNSSVTTGSTWIPYNLHQAAGTDVQSCSSGYCWMPHSTRAAELRNGAGLNYVELLRSCKPQSLHISLCFSEESWGLQGSLLHCLPLDTLQPEGEMGAGTWKLSFSVLQKLSAFILQSWTLLQSFWGEVGAACPWESWLSPQRQALGAGSIRGIAQRRHGSSSLELGSRTLPAPLPQGSGWASKVCWGTEHHLCLPFAVWAWAPLPFASAPHYSGMSAVLYLFLSLSAQQCA